METFFIFVMIILGFCLNLIIAFGTNMYLARLKGIKLPKPYKYIDAKPVIYKVEERHNRIFTIQKWELGYDDVDELFFILVVGAGLFRRYKYNFVQSRGLYNIEQLNKITSLEDEFNRVDQLILDSNKETTSVVDKLNQDFNKYF